jgi:hypothetical protein
MQPPPLSDFRTFSSLQKETLTLTAVLQSPAHHKTLTVFCLCRFAYSGPFSGLSFCSSKRSCTSVCVGICFQFCGYLPRNTVAGSCGYSAPQILPTSELSKIGVLCLALPPAVGYGVSRKEPHELVQLTCSCPFSQRSWSSAVV